MYVYVYTNYSWELLVRDSSVLFESVCTVRYVGPYMELHRSSIDRTRGNSLLFHTYCTGSKDMPIRSIPMM